MEGHGVSEGLRWNAVHLLHVSLQSFLADLLLTDSAGDRVRELRASTGAGGREGGGGVLGRGGAGRGHGGVQHAGRYCDVDYGG